MNITLQSTSAGKRAFAPRPRIAHGMALTIWMALSALVAGAQTSATVAAQTGWLGSGNLIGPNDLTQDFAAALQKQGGRMASLGVANVTVTGTVTDANGSRLAKITVQAPGYLRYEEPGTSRVLTFDGSTFSSKSGRIAAGDTPTVESLMAGFPDMIFLQLARKGLLRRVGSGFRTDNGKNPNYAGPWWTVSAFSPAVWQGLSKGQPLQKDMLIAIDESSWMLSEVRVTENPGAANQEVTQTQYSGWFQQSGQWFPGKIARLESGREVLRFEAQQASVGPQVDSSLISKP